MSCTDATHWADLAGRVVYTFVYTYVTSLHVQWDASRIQIYFCGEILRQHPSTTEDTEYDFCKFTIRIIAIDSILFRATGIRREQYLG